VNLTVKDICEKIWSLEEKYDLLHNDIQGVKIWQLLRMELYYEIAQKTGVFGQPHSVRNTVADKMKALAGLVYNSLMKNPLRGSYTKKVLIFDHPRKKKHNGIYIDIYTKPLINSFSAEDILILEEPYLYQHVTATEDNRKYMDYLQLLTFAIKKLYPIRFNQQDILFIHKLENELYKLFDISLDLHKKFADTVKRYKIQYKLYDHLLQKLKPEKIYVVVSYSHGALIAAAKHNHIPVIEIQHGTMSPYHLGYSFPNGEQGLEYFPDYLYLFGDYWAKSIKLPIARDKIVAYGFPYFSKTKQQYQGITKKERQLLFLSQGVIGKELAKFAYNAAQVLTDYQIVYKLHPGEYDRWKAEYEELNVAQTLENFVIIDNDEVNLYQYLAESPYQIGVFSTAIYEGIAFQCKTILVDLPGLEYMNYLIDGNFAQKVSSMEELRQVLEQNECKEIDIDYFFAHI